MPGFREKLKLPFTIFDVAESLQPIAHAEFSPSTGLTLPVIAVCSQLFHAKMLNIANKKIPNSKRKRFITKNLRINKPVPPASANHHATVNDLEISPLC